MVQISYIQAAALQSFAFSAMHAIDVSPIPTKTTLLRGRAQRSTPPILGVLNTMGVLEQTYNISISVIGTFSTLIQHCPPPPPPPPLKGRKISFWLKMD